MQKLFKIIFYKWMGWRSRITIEQPEKSIICVAPHTSNLDFFIGIIYREAANLNSYFLIKKDWFFWPVGWFLRKISGIPVNRSSKEHLTDSLAAIFKTKDNIHICVTPEGTRSLNNKWKKGFYFIALKANIPIQLYYINYRDKVVCCEKTVYPTGNIKEDFKVINEYYEKTKCLAKYPEKFSPNEIF